MKHGTPKNANKRSHGNSGNLGFTLIEVVVTVIILGMVATVGVMSIGYVYGRDTHNSAKEMSLTLDSVRMESMGRADRTVFLRVEKQSDGYYLTCIYKNGAVETRGSSDMFAGTGMTITFRTAAGANVLVTESNPIDLYFNKGTGAFRTEGGSPEYASVIFTASKTATLVLVWDTGRSYVQ